ncbi:hypothetical protein MMC12_003787 [Toensbergia leucococca]|nr:hypothetical protein [Toensbergia leucococca]
MPQLSTNPFLLAADNHPSLLPLLRTSPHLASSQDAHGYSLLHAAVSYNHISLLRTLVREFHVSVNIKDEDGETPLFVAETVEAAQVLIEELGVDTTIRNAEGITAEEKILGEGDYPTVAAYMRESRTRDATGIGSGEAGDETLATSDGLLNNDLHHPPPLPPNVTVNMGTMESDAVEGEGEVDPEFRRRIEELAAREDFQGDEGQRQLRELITDAVRGVGGDGNARDVRRRVE